MKSEDQIRYEGMEEGDDNEELLDESYFNPVRKRGKGD